MKNSFPPIVTCPLILACCLSIAAHAQRPDLNTAGTAKPSSVVYLRFANLLPIKSEKLSIMRGTKPFLSGLKAGFFLPYEEVVAGDPMAFTVYSGTVPIGQFTLKAGVANSFYTVVIISKGGEKSVLFSQDAPSVVPDSDSSTAPPKRFRGYFGGFEFPYQVNAGSIGQWSVDGDALFVDVPITGNPPETVGVTFTTDDGDKAELFFPIAFSAFRENSLFVTQRGPRRPRVFSFPDNCPPDNESVESP